MMKKVSGALSSGAVSAVLLVAVTLLIALGTVVVQNASASVYVRTYGAGVAGIITAMGLNDVYHSWFLVVPAALLAVNMFARARGRPLSLPALVTVMGTVTVVFGTLYSSIAGMEGIMPISVNESKDVLYADKTAYRLPFTVRLDDFTVERDGDSVGNFRSTLQVCSGGTTAGGVTAVNRPFRWNGYTFYQQSYDPRYPRWTGLKVVKDPGTKFVFMGLLLLNMGIIACVVKHVRKGAAA